MRKKYDASPVFIFLTYDSRRGVDFAERRLNSSSRLLRNLVKAPIIVNLGKRISITPQRLRFHKAEVEKAIQEELDLYKKKTSYDGVNLPINIYSPVIERSHIDHLTASEIAKNLLLFNKDVRMSTYTTYSVDSSNVLRVKEKKNSLRYHESGNFRLFVEFSRSFIIHSSQWRTWIVLAPLILIQVLTCRKRLSIFDGVTIIDSGTEMSRVKVKLPIKPKWCLEIDEFNEFVQKMKEEDLS